MGNRNGGELGVGATIRFMKNVTIANNVFRNNTGGLLGGVINLLLL